MNMPVYVSYMLGLNNGLSESAPHVTKNILHFSSLATELTTSHFQQSLCMIYAIQVL